MAMLPNEINDAPTPVALLDVQERERRYLRSTKPAAEKNGHDGTIPQPLHCRRIWRAEERLRLP
jgi:hypothetical protein